MRDIKKSKMDLRGFYDLIRAAERQGLTALFTDSDTCDTIVDMWPGEVEELEDGVPVILFDTHYSDKTGPSDNNELLDMGTLDTPKCGDIVAEHANGKIVAVSIDCGPGLGNARVTFLKSGLAGVEPPGYTPARPSKKEEQALQLLDTVSEGLIEHLERMRDDATGMLRTSKQFKGMPLEEIDSIVQRWSEALLRGGQSNWRAEYDKLKNGE